LTPQRAVFEDVAGTRWTPYEAIFSRASKHVMADLEVGRRGLLARVWVADAALVASIERAGYSMRDQSGQRALRDVEDLVAERAMLEVAVARPSSVLAWPKRRARSFAPRKRPLAPSVRAMKDSSWKWTVTEIGRLASPKLFDASVWRAYAFCLVVDEPSIEVGIRLEWRKKPKGPQIRDARKRLAAVLAPFGYVSPNVRGMISLEKSVRTVAEARAERDRLDAFLG